jgi:hypothetical protein
MNNASPRRFPSSFPVGGALASLNLLEVEAASFESELLSADGWNAPQHFGRQRPAGEQNRTTQTSPFSRENPAGDFAGFFICLGLAVPAGLLVWAGIVSVLIFLK